MNTQHVLMMIDKGIKKNLRMIDTPRGLLARNIYLKIRFLRVIAFFGLVFLSFFEKPEWCQLNNEVKDTADCRSITNPRKYPGSGKIFYCTFMMIILNN